MFYILFFLLNAVILVNYILMNNFLLWVLKVFKQLNLPPETHNSLSDEKVDVDRTKKPWEIISSDHKIGMPQPLLKELVCVMLFVKLEKR